MKTLTITAEVPDNVAELLARNDAKEWARDAMGSTLACFTQDYWPGDARRLGVEYDDARAAFDVQEVRVEDAANG